MIARAVWGLSFCVSVSCAPELEMATSEKSESATNSMPTTGDDDDDDGDDDDDDGPHFDIGNGTDDPQLPQYDQAIMCFKEASAEDHILTVGVMWPCAGDHDGASLECTAEVSPDDSDPDTIVVHSIYYPGIDPNDACPSDLYGYCPVQLGGFDQYRVHHGSESSYTIDVPGLPEPQCADEDTRSQ